MAVQQEDPQQRQLRGLALLLQLQRKARAAEDLAALGFVIVNESRSLVEYRQAALWLDRPTQPVAAVSGIAQLDAQAPYIVWLNGVCRRQFQTDNHSAYQLLQATDLPESLQAEWQQWLPAFGLWLPLKVQGRTLGGWLLVREQAWQEGEAVLLAELSDAYAHAWQTLQPRKPWWRGLYTPVALKRWALAVILLLLIPVRLSVLAPAEVIAAQPTVIRAPLEGVVDTFQIQPNQAVAAEQLLLTLENTDIANRLEVSRKVLAVAEAEYRKTAQQAMFDADSKAEMTVLKGRMEQHAAEVEYLAEQLARSQIKAPHAGVAIFSDVHDWIGRPVALGERILNLADPAQVELEMRVPVADFIELADGAEAVMFLNIDPQHPLDAEVYSLSYQAEVGTDQVLAYRVKARLADVEQLPRIGLKGTAKLYGQRVTLFYYLFRRPLSGVRQWLGL
nr:HlyD family efflux transporter periplasmic adaptor subunit [Methylomonas sp. WSC-7]